MKYHVRCRKCHARRVLRKHPDEYKRKVRCKVCGELGRFRVVNDVKKRIQSDTCKCGGYHFPHRIGSKNCWYNKDGSKRFEELNLEPCEIDGIPL